MGISYEFDTELDVLRTVWSGEIDGAHAIGTYLRIYADPKYRAGMSEIADLSSATAINISVDDMMRVIAAREEKFGKLKSKVAVIASKDFHFAKSRVFSTFSEIYETESVMAFRTSVEAHNWALGRSIIN